MVKNWTVETNKGEKLWESNLNTELIKITTNEMKERQERNTKRIKDMIQT